MKILRCAIAVVVTGCLLGAPAALFAAPPRTIEGWKKEVSRRRAAVRHFDEKDAALRRRIEAMRREVARLAEQIEALKEMRRSGGENRLLLDYRLENQLKASNELSEKLSRLNQAFHANERRRQREIEGLLAAYDGLIEALTARIAQTRGRRAKSALLAELHRYRSEREGYAAQILPRSPLKVYGIRVDPLDGPEEMLEKADILKDSEEKIRKTIGLIDRRIGELEETRQLIEETVALTIESNFFEDQIFRRSRSVNLSRQEHPVVQATDPSEGGAEEEAPDMNVAGQTPAAGPEENDVPSTTADPGASAGSTGETEFVTITDDDLLQTLDLSVELLLKGSLGNGSPAEIERAIEKLRKHRAILLEQARAFHEDSERLKARAETLERAERRKRAE